MTFLIATLKRFGHPLSDWNVSSYLSWFSATTLSLAFPEWARVGVPQLWHTITEFAGVAWDVVLEFLKNTS